MKSGLLWAWGQRWPTALALARDQGSHLKKCKRTAWPAALVGQWPSSPVCPEGLKGPHSPYPRALHTRSWARSSDHRAGSHLGPLTARSPTGSPSAAGTVQIPLCLEQAGSSGRRNFVPSVCTGRADLTMSQDVGGLRKPLNIKRLALCLVPHLGPERSVVTACYFYSYCQMATRSFLGDAERLTRAKGPHRYPETRSQPRTLFLVLCI